jgi:Ca-activated chloride channel homolog
MFWALSFLLIPISVLSGQPPAPTAEASGTTISVSARLVVLQTVQAFQSEDVPIAVGLVVDNSGSMKSKRSDVIAASMAFARLSNPADEMFVVNFNEHATFSLPDTKLFSASPAELESALLKPVPAGETALYDAIVTALSHIQKGGNERKVLVVISDGGDNASKHTLDQVLLEIGRSDVVIYTIGLFDEEDSDSNPRVLRRIASASGGEAFLPKVSADAVRICEGIARDIRTQYMLSYSPSNQKFDGGYRTVQVSVTRDNGAPLKARARSGYIASADPDSAAGPAK